MPVWATVLIAVGSVAGAILTIWALLDRLMKKFYTVMDSQIERAFAQNEKLQEEKVMRIVEKISTRTNHKIDGLIDEFNMYRQEQEIRQVKQDAQDHLLVTSVLTLYKQEIRDIYYKLRDTGIISDQDKDYVDRIYPLYYALGGNSDTTQKMGEIQRVVERRTQEAFDKAREETEKNNK